jgi:cytidine deaminase
MSTPPSRDPTSDEALLYEAAERATANAYAPYSRFPVGAAVETVTTRDAGTPPVTAANIENASYGLTICAERSAIVRAIAEGVGPEAVAASTTALGLPPGELPDLTKARCITAIAVATPARIDIGSPCGACRQVMGEFAVPGMTVTMRLAGQLQTVEFDDLLPAQFSL